MKKAKKMLCIGAVVLASMTSLSGCNLLEKNLSDEQIDKLMNVLDNSDKFMDENISLLEKSNNKLSLEEAYRLFVLARLSFASNFQGVRDNMTIVKTIGDKTTTEYYWNVPMGDYFFVSVDKVDNDTSTTVVYRLDNKVYEYENDNGTKTKQEVTDWQTVDAYLNNGLYFDVLTHIDLNDKHILKTEILENGNHNVVFGIKLTGSGESTIVFQAEVTSDAKIINLAYTHSALYEEGGIKKVLNQDVKITYTYGTVTEEIISGYVNEAKAFQNN